MLGCENAGDIDEQHSPVNFSFDDLDEVRDLMFNAPSQSFRSSATRSKKNPPPQIQTSTRLPTGVSGCKYHQPKISRLDS
jgi:hypothetical protein